MPHADYDPVKKDIIVTTIWSEKELIKAIPGSLFRDGIWRLPASWASLVMLRGIFGAPLTLGEMLISWAWELRQTRVDPALEVRAELRIPNTDESPEARVIRSWRAEHDGW